MFYEHHFNTYDIFLIFIELDNNERKKYFPMNNLNDYSMNISLWFRFLLIFLVIQFIAFRY